ncbi:unnamed protein product [Ixodes pacificus]
MLAWRRHTNRPVSSEKYMLCHLVNVFRMRATFENTSRGNEAKATNACDLWSLSGDQSCAHMLFTFGMPLKDVPEYSSAMHS